MLDILEKYYNDGLLHKQIHPTKDLTIWNYSPKVQYEKLWDDITIQCRGLVTNSKGDIVARPFKKFFNYEEHKPEDIPNEHYEVFEKMDGSLGILFNYEDEWIMATRGSFTSPQAIKAKEILDKKYDISPLRKDNTYLFEIIYPENRIVVDYGNEEKLVALGAIHTETGDEASYDALFTMSGLGFEIVRLWKTWDEDWKTLQKEISKQNEGYVVRFKNGFRMKIKGDEYVRLHKLLTNISSRDIWEHLKDQKSLEDIISDVPDEFYDWVKKTAMDLNYACFQLRETAGKLHDGFRYGKFNDRDPEPTKKEFAEFVMKQQEVLRPIMFAMWNKNNETVDKIIWKTIKPKYTKPFKKDEN